MPFWLSCGLVVIVGGCGQRAPMPPAGKASWDALRKQMVAEQLAARDIRNERVLEAMGRVPRHLFVPDAERSHACEDRPLPIGEGQTISQPYVVALMTQTIHPQPG